MGGQAGAKVGCATIVGCDREQRCPSKPPSPPCLPPRSGPPPHHHPTTTPLTTSPPPRLPPTSPLCCRDAAWNLIKGTPMAASKGLAINCAGRRGQHQASGRGAVRRRLPPCRSAACARDGSRPCRAARLCSPGSAGSALCVHLPPSRIPLQSVGQSPTNQDTRLPPLLWPLPADACSCGRPAAWVASLLEKRTC